MAIKASTGLRNYLLATGSLRAGFAGGLLKIYNGTEPATADAALSGNSLLCTVSVGGTGNGLNFDTAAANGTIAKSSETWSGTNASAGDATFYRLCAAGDTGAASTTERRIQGSVGVTGADLNLNSISLVQNGTTQIDYFTVTLPTF